VPSFTHELLVDLFRHAPKLARTLLVGMGIKLPDGQDEVASIDLSQVTSPAYACDMVVRVRGRDERTAACVVVEVQLERDDEKRLTWPVYVTAARRAFSCPATLLVVAPEKTVAQWIKEPIAIGHPGFVLAPIVIGPDAVPEVTDPELARRLPELAVLSALAHPDQDAVALAALPALEELAEDRSRLYLDVIWTAVSPAVRAALEAWMQKYEYQSDFARRYFTQGQAEGEAKGKAEGTVAATRAAIMRVLERRGFCLSAEMQRRIEAEVDLARLERCLDVAVTAASIADVFADA